ncbi:MULTISPECIES: septal ring lytic transglycosylase RlpA family protein [unclassified Bradyrhizobium]
MIVIATVSAWTGLHPTPAVGQTFNDRWSIIPKAHAEPAPEGLDQIKKDEPQAQPPNRQELLNDLSGIQSFNRVFSGKASYYSYSKGKTASGSSFDRNQLTAAPPPSAVRHESPSPDLETNNSVVVRITDRGPWVRGRVLDLSLAAARTLGITDRGVAQVRAEVL